MNNIIIMKPSHTLRCYENISTAICVWFMNHREYRGPISSFLFVSNMYNII